MWHKWNGGDNPVPGKKVIFKTERWFEKHARLSDELDWSESGLGAIVEYEVVDNLQSRVNDANLGDALKEIFREDTYGANKDQFAHLNDLPLVSEKYDTVQRPAHYNQSGIECIDAIAASMTPVEFQAYLKGNVQKYLWRYQHKNGVEDCRKAQWYLDRLVKELSK